MKETGGVFAISVAAEHGVDAGAEPARLRAARAGRSRPHRRRARACTAPTTSSVSTGSGSCSPTGLNLAGIARVLELEDEVAQLRAEVARLRAR